MVGSIDERHTVLRGMKLVATGNNHERTLRNHHDTEGGTANQISESVSAEAVLGKPTQNGEELADSLCVGAFDTAQELDHCR